MQEDEKLNLLNVIGQTKLENIIKLLGQHIHYDEISKLIGIDTSLIEQVFKVFLPEQYKAQFESEDSISEVLQEVNKGISRK